MAATVTEVRKVPGLRSVRSVGTIALSGSYATGGDAAAIPKPYTTKAPLSVSVRSRNGNNVAYDVTNQKIKFFSAAATELAAGAYAAGYTADVIDYEAEFPKFG